MKALMGALTALALVATPAVAGTQSSPSTKTVTTKSAKEKATTTVSTKGNTTIAKTTVTKRHRRARRHVARCTCPSSKVHRTHHRVVKKASAKKASESTTK